MDWDWTIPCRKEKNSRLHGSIGALRIAKPTAARLRMFPMPTVAELLRTAREARNLTVHEVADATKIRTDHVRALEEGNYNVFTAPVYIRGFVRTYSNLLKLDVPKVMATLDAELAGTEKFSEPPPLSNERRGVLDFVMLQLSKINFQKGIIALGVLVLLLILLFGYWLWRNYQERDPLSDLPPAVYEPGGKQSGETLPLPQPGKK